MSNRDNPVEQGGVQFYYPHPYLLVSFVEKQNGENTESSATVQLLYLPDLTKPMEAEFKSGWFGSSNLSLTLENGMISAIGVQSDTKVPETIASVAGMLSAIGEKSAKSMVSSEEPFKLYKFVVKEVEGEGGKKKLTLELDEVEKP